MGGAGVTRSSRRISSRGRSKLRSYQTFIKGLARAPVRTAQGM